MTLFYCSEHCIWYKILKQQEWKFNMRSRKGVFIIWHLDKAKLYSNIFTQPGAVSDIILLACDQARFWSRGHS